MRNKQQLLPLRVCLLHYGPESASITDFMSTRNGRGHVFRTTSHEHARRSLSTCHNEKLFLQSISWHNSSQPMGKASSCFKPTFDEGTEHQWVAGTPTRAISTTHHRITARGVGKSCAHSTNLRMANLGCRFSPCQGTTNLSKSWWAGLQQHHVLLLSHVVSLCCEPPFRAFPAPFLSFLQQWAESLFELGRTSQDPAISSFSNSQPFLITPANGSGPLGHLMTRSLLAGTLLQTFFCARLLCFNLKTNELGNGFASLKSCMHASAWTQGHGQ